MAISTRTEDAGHTGNELVAAIFELPLLDEAATALETCHELSRRQRNDTDVLWLIDRIRAAGNRIPKSIISRLFARGAKGIDVSLSNVKGMPLRNWVGGVEVLQSIPFLIGGPAVAVTMISGARGATLGVVTDPEAIADPERLMSRFAEGFAEVSALAG